jgi:hypothetical protein
MDDTPEIVDPPKRTAVRVVCECGSLLEVLVLPRDEVGFVVTCPGCGTRYRRQMTDLEHRAVPGEVVTVVLPRSQPHW